MIPNYDDIKECLAVVKALFDSTLESPECLEAGSYIMELNYEFKVFREMLSNIENKLTTAINDDHFYEFKSIMNEVIQLQKRFIESTSFTEFIRFKELRLLTSEDKLLTKAKENQEVSSHNTDLEKYKENIKEMEEHNKLKSKQISKEICEEIIISNQKIINDGKELIKHLESKIQEAEKISQQLAENNVNLIKGIEEMDKGKNKVLSADMQKEKQRICECSSGEENKHTETEGNEEGRIKDVDVDFRQIYERYADKSTLIYEFSDISDIPNFYFRLSLDNEKDKEMLKEFVVSKLKLPILKGIHIDLISDADENLNNFLSDCIPSQLQLLSINWGSKNFVSIKSGFYLSSLCKVVSIVTEEAYLSSFDFNEQELQAIVQAAHNTERLVLAFSSIHCSLALDFRTDSKYNIKSLSFQGCGRQDLKMVTTDWKSDPSCFENIVNAICNSGLKDSLQNISICANLTLSQENVQELFNSKGMSHITINTDYADPLLA